jgi:hypothetical protein
VEIPHLSFLAVPVLDLTVRRVSTERDDDDESRSNTTTRSKAGSNRKRGKSSDDSMLSAASAANAVSKQQQEKKLKVIESHLKAMEDIEREKLSHRTKRDKQANHLSLTAELKTIEEMISMKRTELQHYNTLDPEREVLDRQLKKLRRRRDRLMQLVCDSDDDSDDGDANNEAV